MQGAQVRALVGELRSCMPRSVAKKKKGTVVKVAELIESLYIIDVEISKLLALSLPPPRKSTGK